MFVITCNYVFARPNAYKIRLQAYVLDYLIKFILFYGASEFISQTFDNYFNIFGIDC